MGLEELARWRHSITLSGLSIIAIVGTYKINQMFKEEKRESSKSDWVSMEDRNGDGLKDVIIHYDGNKEAIYYAFKDNITDSVTYSRHREIEH